MKMKQLPLFLLLLTGGWLAGTSTYAQSTRKQTGLKKGANVSLNITDAKKQPPSTFFNIGLLRIRLFPLLNLEERLSL